jgi:hypothetical protein
MEDAAASLQSVATALLADAMEPVVPEPTTSAASLVGLLRAETMLVKFLGRDEELQKLREWCDGEAEHSAWLLTGPAGQGKTRLAMQLRAELARTGMWASRVLRGPADVTEVSDLCRRAAVAGLPVLLVIDYAAEFGAFAFAELIRLLTHEQTMRLRWRLLLLARNSGDWWQPQLSRGASAIAVRSRLVARGTEVPEKEFVLNPLFPDPRERGPAFDMVLAQLRPAVTAFAAAHGMTVTNMTVVPDLSRPDLGSALMLQVAAIVSLLPSADTPPNPGDQSSAVDLIDRILDLECQQHWLYADSDVARLYRPTEEAFGHLARYSGELRWRLRSLLEPWLALPPHTRPSG